jgi:hypothetical protein
VLNTGRRIAFGSRSTAGSEPRPKIERCDRRHAYNELTPLSAAGAVTQDADGSLHVGAHEIPSLRSHDARQMLAYGTGKQSRSTKWYDLKRVEPWSPEDESEAQVQGPRRTSAR